MNFIPKSERLIISLCNQIDNLEFELAETQKELDETREMLARTQSSSIFHSQKMIGMMLIGAMEGGFHDKMSDHGKKEIKRIANLEQPVGQE